MTKKGGGRLNIFSSLGYFSCFLLNRDLGEVSMDLVFIKKAFLLLMFVPLFSVFTHNLKLQVKTLTKGKEGGAVCEDTNHGNGSRDFKLLKFYHQPSSIPQTLNLPSINNQDFAHPGLGFFVSLFLELGILNYSLL